MMILGYWDIRGLAHAIRLLLEYTGTPYKEKRYVTGEAPDYDKSQWLKEKEKLGLDFPNLPYLLDGDVKLTQSNTILRYIARKHGLCGKSVECLYQTGYSPASFTVDQNIWLGPSWLAGKTISYNNRFILFLHAESETTKNNVSLLENQAMDFRLDLATITYDPKFEELKGPYLEKLPVALARFSNFLGDRSWFAGEKITYVDFVMYDVLDQHNMLEPSCLKAFRNLQDFLARFEALPPIAAYMASPRFMKTPITDRMASWANHK